MNTEIIPAIIAEDINEISQKISQVESLVTWVQIDVADGIFSPNITWNKPEELKNIVSKVSLEMHLMIANPAEHIDAWVNSGAKRIIIHVDATNNYDEVALMAKKVKDNGIAFGIALNPEVLVADVKNLVPLADVVLLLAVSPGFSGQTFNENILEKIGDLRQNFPDVIIEIDGGVNPQVAKKCIAAGANILISGSYVFDAPDMAKALEELQ